MPSFFGNRPGTNITLLGSVQSQVDLNLGVTLLGTFVGNAGVSVTPPPALPPMVVNEPPRVDPLQVIPSLSSSTAFHSTLFEDFGLRAAAVYNFYTLDEQVAFVADASASLGTLPRYVTLQWNPASAPRNFLLSRKGLRPFDPRVPSTPPALDVPTARGSVANGYVGPGCVQALLVDPLQMPDPPDFDEDLFLGSPSAAGAHATAVVTGPNGSEFHVTSVPSSTSRVRVNFIDPSIAGALDPGRISVAVDYTHLASLGALAKLVSGLEVISEFNQDVSLRNPVPKFPAAAGSPDLMYIGYVLERYTLDASGSMDLTRTVVLDDPGQSDFVDREVVYGGMYSYRLRALVQWTHGPNVGFFGTSSLDRSPPIDVSAARIVREASFYAAEWSDWARVAVLDQVPPDPPDELTVTPSSQKGLVRVVWKMPGDPQRDIAKLTLLRSVGISDRYSDWQVMGEFVPSNGAFVDLDVAPHELSHRTYMYAMYSTSFHGERSVLSGKLAVRLTERSRYLGEELPRLIGPAGDDPMSHAVGPRPRDPTEVIAYDRIVTYIRAGRSTLPIFDRNYVIEVQSLATGERAEVRLSVDTTDVRLTTGGTARPA